jgi:hypothetical protein
LPSSSGLCDFVVELCDFVGELCDFVGELCDFVGEPCDFAGDRQRRVSETRDTLREYRGPVPPLTSQELACSGVGETPSRR